MAENLVPVTVGNLIGGTVLLAAVVWFVYLRHRRRRKNLERTPGALAPLVGRILRAIDPRRATKPPDFQ